MIRNVARWLAPFMIALAPASCAAVASTANGACAVDSASQPQCGDGFVRYACDGSARPDDPGGFVDGVPDGTVCTDEGAASGGGEGYCCSSSTTDCVYDPVAGCTGATYGYQCRGSNRPEAYDPNLFCGEGLVDGDLIVYCCGSAALPHGCQQGTGAGCPSTLVPWVCTDQSLPTEAELGSNQSRADFNLLVCAVPKVTPTAMSTIRNYCCFTPTSVPARASCLFDTAVAGCAPGSFGFACTGPDAPGDDYSRISCPTAGVPGVNAQGYPSTLYCCQYQ
jgi:hypothetical protein